MAYIGNIPAVQYASFSKQTLTADSSTVAFTLDNAVANENELEVFVNNVRQEPGSGNAYTASGTTLTMSAAPTTGDSFYVIFQGKATQTVTPGSGTVTNAMLAGSIDLTSKVTGTLPLANGGTGATTLAGAGLSMTPSFSATLSSNQSVSDSVTTEILFNSEHFDTNSAYNTANGRFTVPTGEGGKYLFSVSVRFNNATSNRNAIDIQKNQSSDGQNVAFEGTGGQYLALSGSVVMNLSAGDYVSVLYYQTSGGAIEVRTDSQFSGFKLIGV